MLFITYDIRVIDGGPAEFGGGNLVKMYHGQSMGLTIVYITSKIN